jgi:hypothetical protein
MMPFKFSRWMFAPIGALVGLGMSLKSGVGVMEAAYAVAALAAWGLVWSYIAEFVLKWEAFRSADSRLPAEVMLVTMAVMMVVIGRFSHFVISLTPESLPSWQSVVISWALLGTFAWLLARHYVAKYRLKDPEMVAGWQALVREKLRERD